MYLIDLKIFVLSVGSQNNSYLKIEVPHYFIIVISNNPFRLANNGNFLSLVFAIECCVFK